MEPDLVRLPRIRDRRASMRRSPSIRHRSRRHACNRADRRPGLGRSTQTQEFHQILAPKGSRCRTLSINRGHLLASTCRAQLRRFPHHRFGPPSDRRRLPHSARCRWGHREAFRRPRWALGRRSPAADLGPEAVLVAAAPEWEAVSAEGGAPEWEAGVAGSKGLGKN